MVKGEPFRNNVKSKATLGKCQMTSCLCLLENNLSVTKSKWQEGSDEETEEDWNEHERKPLVKAYCEIAK